MLESWPFSSNSSADEFFDPTGFFGTHNTHAADHCPVSVRLTDAATEVANIAKNLTYITSSGNKTRDSIVCLITAVHV